jgi:hypothetical protein
MTCKKRYIEYVKIQEYWQTICIILHMILKMESFFFFGGLVCLLNVGRSRFIDVTFGICGIRLHIRFILYALVWCVGGLVGIHLDMALL